MKKIQHSKKIIEVVPRIMDLIRTQIRSYARDELTIPQFRVLNKLSRSPLTHKEVADWMGITPATLTRIVDSLVMRQLATRKTNPQDRRQIYLAPTAAGKRLARHYLDQTDQWFEARIASLSVQDQRRLQEGLTILDDLFLDI